MIVKAISEDTKSSTKITSLWDIMHAPESSYAVLERLYPNKNTRRHKVTTMVKLFSASGLTDSEARKWWSAKMNELNDDITQDIKRNEMPAKYKDRIVTVDEVMSKAEDLCALSEDEAEKTLTDSLMRLLIVLMSDIKPKRSDLGAVKIVDSAKACEAVKDHNCIILSRVNKNSRKWTGEIVMKHYKTDKVYGEIREPLQERTVRVLRESLSHYPREWLFVDSRYKRPYKNNDSYSQFVTRTFQHYFDRKFSTTLWRHVYASQMISIDHSEVEREETARLMAHSTTQGLRYRWIPASNT